MRKHAVKCTVQWELTTQHNHLASLAKWLSVRLQTKWLWVGIPLLSLKLQMWHLLQTRSSLSFRQTIECRFTLKLVRDMITSYSHMHRTYKYSQYSSIIWPVWLNGWVFLYELSGCGFESQYCHVNLSFHNFKICRISAINKILLE